VERGGKSSAINLGLKHTSADVIMTIDADSHIGKQGIWRILQPLRDPRVGGVSGNVVARNPWVNLVTWLQAFEYLNSILVGRILNARLGMLAICSGAFAAFSRAAIERGGGWDTGPGEDADITIRIRKSGYDIHFVPEAECFTNVPVRWRSLFKQRLRWDRSLVRYNLRKHIDVAFFWSSNFRLTNFLHLLDIFYLNILCAYGFWVFVVFHLVTVSLPSLGYVMLTVYLGYAGFGVIQALIILYYSIDRKRDAITCLVVPFAPSYQLFLRFVRTIAITDELLFRRSYQDNYVPERVRNATWHW
jgi:cellulose synthase/poly-beta-1,6-N-acetylglucosamine synthase-like glycosyltransferase